MKREAVRLALTSGCTRKQISTDLDMGFERPQYHVKGNVRIAGSRVRCNVHVAEVSSGQRLWAEKYDGDVAEIFELEDQLADQISAALEVELTEGSQVGLWHREAGNSDAYAHF